jgi:mono/diheme cytochrome c family protein
MILKRNHFFILAICCLIFSCGEALYVPMSLDADEQSKLVAGRKLYIEKCSNCHNLYLPQNFSDEKWNRKLDTMQIRAKINVTQRELIYHYIVSHPRNK